MLKSLGFKWDPVSKSWKREIPKHLTELPISREERIKMYNELGGGRRYQEWYEERVREEIYRVLERLLEEVKEELEKQGAQVAIELDRDAIRLAWKILSSYLFK